ncbi:E3 SUMO-protein ligase PIAS2 [Parasteatoda tepidariorum]|uniref:E3 SUMO-protein ligase PIAS2 n=1 Tax=Parasteatoda tepidariorum TaxID=114398 RepID=UPI00077FC9F2|nr:E3 SUMO-protein ligase PIAS2 [Parasteatoda tepidariorum]
MAMASLTLADYDKMIRSLRVSDLQTLLHFAGRNKMGKKNELQQRALELLKLRSESILAKIREIHAYKFSTPRGHTDLDIHPLGTVNESSAPSYVSRHQSTYPMNNRSMSSRSGMISNRNPMSGRGPMLTPMADMMPPSKILPPNLSGAMDMYNQYPLSPDLKFKELPFYDILANLIRPTSLIVLHHEKYREREYSFCFTPIQLSQLDRNPDVQVQMRMCALDVTSEQDDEIPPSICVRVNNRLVTLPTPIPTNRPGVEPKRPKRPIDITTLIKRSDTENNIINISWAASNGKPNVFAINLVQRLSSTTLIKRLKDNGVRNPDHTTALIKEKLCQDRDSEIATMSLRGSLMCPLGKIKMRLPCRALTCAHLQCFDATLYLQMNEKKPKWICPVCDKPANFKDLAIDGLFLDIISRAPEECNEVQFHENGSWTPVMPIVKKTPPISETIDATPKASSSSAPKPKRPIEVIDLDSDSDTEDSWPLITPQSKTPRIQSDPDSPIIIESSSNNGPFASTGTGAKECDPFKPSTSKTELPSFVPVEKREPVTLDIDVDIDCISNLPPITYSGPSTAVDTVPLPSVSTTSSAFQETKNAVKSITGDGVSTSGQLDFDFYSLIRNPDDSLDNHYSDITDNDEPEIIDLDDDDDD